MERNEETYMNFPIEETSEHDQSRLPLSKRRHVEEFSNIFYEPSLVSEEEGQVPLGNVARYDRDLSNQESKPPSYEVLDPERREPALNQLSHQDITTRFNSDVLGKREIPPSEEHMPQTASFQPENNDEGQFVVGLPSPADSLASGSRRLRDLRISEKTHGPFTPQTPTTPIIPSQKPQKAQVVGTSELVAIGPIVDIKELPSQSRPLEEICNGSEIPDGGLAVYLALLHVVRKEYEIHQMMRSLFGSVGIKDVHLISVEDGFQVFMTPDVERLSNNFKTMDLESDVAKHRKGRLADVKALEPLVKIVHDLAEENRIHVSKRIYHNLKDTLRICGEANDGSYLAKVYQALEGKKNSCLIEVHTGLTGHYEEKFPIVCLEREKILLVVEEWLMKNQKGRRHRDENIHLVTCDQRCPVNDSWEVENTLHRVQLVSSPPSAALVQPNYPHGRGSGVVFHQRPTQSTFPGDCPPNQPRSSQPFSAQNHGDLYQNPNPYTHPQSCHHGGSEYGSLTISLSVEEALQGFEGDQRSDPVDNSREVFRSLHRGQLDNSQPSAALVQPNHPRGRGSDVISHQRPAQSTFPGDCPLYQPWSSQPFSAQNHGGVYQNPDLYTRSMTHPQVGGVSRHVWNFGEMSPHPSGYLEPNKVPPPPPPAVHHHGVPPLQNRHVSPPPPIHHRDDGIRYHPPYPPSPSITGCDQRPLASVGPGTAYRPSQMPPQSVACQPWGHTRH